MNAMMPQIAARLFDVPLMVDPRKAAVVAAVLGPQVLGGRITIDGVDADEAAAPELHRHAAGRLGNPLGRRIADAKADDVFNMVDGVAVIGIEGSLVHKGKWFGSNSGDTSYEGIQALVARARGDDAVKAVAFEIDSFGGEVAGAFDTAQMIAELSAEKPTIAILTDYALSAGYLLASAARAVIVPETGYAGSIGVITMHVDYSAALEKDGIKVTVLTSGAHKAEGNPFEPLPASVAARIRAELDAGRDLFAGAVGRHRGDRMNKDAALATEAMMFRGESAVAAGLVDGVMRPSEAFDAFVSQVNRNSASRRTK